MSYDYMVLAGTQGKMNHAKKDRMFEIAEQNELPTFYLLKVEEVDLEIQILQEWPAWIVWLLLILLNCQV